MTDRIITFVLFAGLGIFGLYRATRIDQRAKFLRVAMVLTMAGVLLFAIGALAYETVPSWYRIILYAIAIGGISLTVISRMQSERDPATDVANADLTAKYGAGIAMTLAPFKRKKNNGEEIG